MGETFQASASKRRRERYEQSISFREDGWV